jgi:hypothetical protein
MVRSRALHCSGDKLDTLLHAARHTTLIYAVTTRSAIRATVKR